MGSDRRRRGRRRARHRRGGRVGRRRRKGPVRLDRALGRDRGARRDRRASDVPAVVTFVNNEAETVELWYLDEDCVEQLWTTVEAGMTSREDSFVGDYWQVFQPDSGEVLKEFYSTAEPSAVVVPAPEDCS